MQFTSLAFAIFLPIVFILYWAVPQKFRNIFLLLASYSFYMTFSIGYVLLLIAMSLVSYFVGRNCKKGQLICGVVLQVFILGFFKYAGLLPGKFQSILIPVGISFYLFKSISYMVDVYRKELEPEKNIVDFLLYVSFFPDIVSGPINRAKDLIPQFREEKTFSYDFSVYGMRQILWGLFMKLLVADTLARYVNPVFETPGAYMGVTYIVIMIFYTLEIYCDFAGYSYITIGVAKLFGITSVKNFDKPYFACNVKEFWDRWHISLSTWLRDYVYFPLGGSRKGKVRTYINLMITFLVSGIWHGANLTFLVWGFLHGFYQVIYRFYKNHIKIKIPKIIGMGITFLSVAVAWIFFRVNTVKDGLYMLRYMFYDMNLLRSYHKLNMVRMDLYLILISLGILFVFDILSEKKDMFSEIGKLKAPIRWIFYFVFATAILIFHIHNGMSQEFIYFQF